MRRRGVSVAEFGIVAILIAIFLVFAVRNMGYRTSCLYQHVGKNIGNSNYTNGCMDTSSDEIRWKVYAGSDNVYALGMATAGTFYTESIPLAYSIQGYDITYTLYSGTLPIGLSLNNHTGIISGIPSNSSTGPAYTQTIQLMASDKDGTTRQPLYVKIPVRGKIIFKYTGAEQFFHANEAMAPLRLKAWGAGGGASGIMPGGENAVGWGGYDNNDYAGGGGYATGIATVSGDELLSVIVGQGGSNVEGSHAFGGGGASYGPDTDNEVIDPYTNQYINANHWSGGGGGASSVTNNGMELIVAGGGGGAGAFDPYAGAGGGLVGGSSVERANNSTAFSMDGGQGGTQTAGGIPVITSDMYSVQMNGTKGQGGDDVIYNDGGGGGGGGGYYGGSAGNDIGGGGGGGGSSYIGMLSSASTEPGSNQQAANQGDEDILPGIGEGYNDDQIGGNGEVVIYWGNW